MTAEILGERDIEQFVGSWTLIPSVGGAFELTVNGDLLYSKKQLGRHAEPGEIKALVGAKLAALKAEWKR